MKWGWIKWGFLECMFFYILYLRKRKYIFLLIRSDSSLKKKFSEFSFNNWWFICLYMQPCCSSQWHRWSLTVLRLALGVRDYDLDDYAGEPSPACFKCVPAPTHLDCYADTSSSCIFHHVWSHLISLTMMNFLCDIVKFL